MFIATQLNWTELNSTELNSTQLTQLNSVQPSQSCFCLWRHDLKLSQLCQLNSTRRRYRHFADATQLNSTSSCRHVHGVNNCHLSMNVVTQLTQFVGHDVINKTRLTWLFAVQLGQLSSVESCRYKHPLKVISKTTRLQFFWHTVYWQINRVKIADKSSKIFVVFDACCKMRHHMAFKIVPPRGIRWLKID